MSFTDISKIRKEYEKNQKEPTKGNNKNKRKKVSKRTKLMNCFIKGKHLLI
jgi:hypothetical protein